MCEEEEWREGGVLEKKKKKSDIAKELKVKWVD